MLLRSIALGLVGTMYILDSRLLGRMNFERLLIMSTLIGLVLGDLERGLLVDAPLELVSPGLVSIGAAAPPDMSMASTTATIFAILSGLNVETTPATATPVFVLGQMLGVLTRAVLSNLTHWTDNLINERKFSRVRRIHIVYGTVSYLLICFILIFLAVYFGTNLVKNVVSSISVQLTNGLTLASKILPAYGFALLLQMILTKKMIPFLLLGFLIIAYSGLSITGIIAFVCIVVFVMVQVKFNGKDDRIVVSEPDPLGDLQKGVFL